MDGLLHSTDTQICEAVNSTAITVHPKRLCLARSNGGAARQALTAARFNDGLAASTAAVLQKLGMMSDAPVLQRLDERRAKCRCYRSSVPGKRKRKEAVQSRKARHTQPLSDDSEGDDGVSDDDEEEHYRTGQGLDDV